MHRRCPHRTAMVLRHQFPNSSMYLCQCQEGRGITANQKHAVLERPPGPSAVLLCSRELALHGRARCAICGTCGPGCRQELPHYTASVAGLGYAAPGCLHLHIHSALLLAPCFSLPVPPAAFRTLRIFLILKMLTQICFVVLCFVLFIFFYQLQPSKWMTLRGIPGGRTCVRAELSCGGLGLLLAAKSGGTYRVLLCFSNL